MALYTLDQSPWSPVAFVLEYDEVTLDVLNLRTAGTATAKALVTLRLDVAGVPVAITNRDKNFPVLFSRDGSKVLQNLQPLRLKMRWERGRTDKVTGRPLPDRLLLPENWAGMSVEWVNPIRGEG